jgi:hypothetical protein
MLLEIKNKILELKKNNKNMNNDAIYENLLKNNGEIWENKEDNYEEYINFIMYDLYQYINPKYEEKEKRQNQFLFRKELEERYKHCVISNSSIITCQACHIIPFAECEEKDKYNVSNGLLLRSDLHVLFDKKLLKINPDTLQIEISKEILEDENNNKIYGEYHNKKIKVNSKSLPFLKKIYE